MALDRIHHRLFVGTRIPAEMTVYDSLSGVEIVSVPGPETMDGVYYDADLKRIYMSGGRWYGTPEASPGWVYVYQQKDADHYELVSKIRTRPGSPCSLDKYPIRAKASPCESACKRPLCSDLYPAPNWTLCFTACLCYIW
jgi:hypothetical protein